MDLYLNEAGDLETSPNGDLRITDTVWRDDVQQIYFRMMTDVGDFLLHPTLGADLSRLYGMPQNPETGNLGIALITEALNREGRFTGKDFVVKAVPIGYQTIRFDVHVRFSTQTMVLSIDQDLGVI